jgi:hypothetical protein
MIHLGSDNSVLLGCELPLPRPPLWMYFRHSKWNDFLCPKFSLNYQNIWSQSIIFSVQNLKLPINNCHSLFSILWNKFGFLSTFRKKWLIKWFADDNGRSANRNGNFANRNGNFHRLMNVSTATTKIVFANSTHLEMFVSDNVQ